MTGLSASASPEPNPTHRSVAVRDTLSTAPMRILGRMPWSSNATFLVEFNPGTSESGETPITGVYKPAAGEQPLWDFPSGLWRREIASFELSDALGFDLVPVTVHRRQGDFGEGSVQLFIDARFEEHYFTIREMGDHELDDQLRLLCAFDIIANSADRKGGHCLIDPENSIWAIDNGLSFHSELKLRTVIWDFAGEPIPDSARRGLEVLCNEGAPPVMSELLDTDEVAALLRRAGHLLESGILPFDPTGRRYPWPLV